jgi:DNA polymerase-3 subunit delta
VRIYHNQLTNTLQQSWFPVWLVFGDEPWQKSNSLQLIKQFAHQQGFQELIRFSTEDNLDWQQLAQEYQALSLFSQQRIIELELTKTTLSTEAIKILTHIVESPCQDILLIIHGNKLDAAVTKKAWFKQLAEIGCYLPVYPLEGKSLTIWLQQQAQQYQLSFDKDAQQLLLTLFEGNLLALDQELQKLILLFGSQTITLSMLETILINQAKFTPFQLIDAWLDGNLPRCFNMLEQLAQEDQAVAPLIWLCHKTLTQLLDMQQLLQQGTTMADVLKQHGIWDKQKPRYQQALKQLSANNIARCLHRLADTDLLSKSTSEFNPYLLLADVLATLYYGEQTQAFSLAYEFDDL